MSSEQIHTVHVGGVTESSAIKRAGKRERANEKEKERARERARERGRERARVSGVCMSWNAQCEWGVVVSEDGEDGIQEGSE